MRFLFPWIAAPRRGVLLFLSFSVWILGAATVVLAVDDVQLEIERIDGQGWTAEDISVDVRLPSERIVSSARIARLRSSAWKGVLRDLRFDCRNVKLEGSRVRCDDAVGEVVLPEAGLQRLRGAIEFDRNSGALAADVRFPNLAGGSARVRFAADSSWRVHATLERVAIEQAVALAAVFELSLPSFTASGRVSGTIEATGREAPQRIVADVKLEALTANNESGSIASDQLTIDVRATLESTGTGWAYDFTLASAAGQAYVDPVFLDFGEHPFALKANGAFSADKLTGAFDITHADVVKAAGHATLAMSEPEPLRDLQLHLHELHFPAAYTSYMQPFLLDTPFKSMETSGRIEGALSVENGRPAQVDLGFVDIAFDDGSGMLAMSGLNGRVGWRAGDDDDEDVVLRSGSERSHIHWSDGVVMNMALGAAALEFTTIGRNFRLVEPTRIPIFDGSLDVESLRIRNAGLPTIAFMVDATIQPISVVNICRAFGWPEFGGQLSGTISKLRLREGVVTLGTTLQANVFDGHIAVSDLRLEDPLGKWPRFHANAAIDNLNLELVTRAFSFGRITGRLSGAVNDLQLFNWQPIAFDARLYTPPNDRSRRRISQRAVENIGSIGGGSGVTRALSSGFLRFFEEFHYDRLGISCRLQNEVCVMDGVGPAPNGGYYLVKGSGLPRIDVIGNARRVDWPRLVGQLIAISKSEGAVVK